MDGNNEVGATPVPMFMSETVSGRMQTRKKLIQQAGLGLAGLLSAPALARAQSRAITRAESSIATQTVRLLNYVDWHGKNEFQNFTRKTGINVKEIVLNTDNERIAKLAIDPSSADMLLMETADFTRLSGLNLLAKLDFVHGIPNYKYVGEFAKVDLFGPKKAQGIPTDFGRTSFAYRPDLVKEKLRSYADVFAVAPKYSGKITLFDYSVETLDVAIVAAGFDVHTEDPTEIKKGADLLIKTKPHLKALVTTDMMKPLFDGSGVIAMDWDFDVAANAALHPHVPIRWVENPGQIRSYLEGWGAVRTSKVLSAVQQLMNYHLDPKVYANFVNTLRFASVERAARAYITHDILKIPILNPTLAVQRRIVFGPVRSAKAQRVFDLEWERFKSA